MFNTEQNLVNAIKCNWKSILLHKNWNDSSDYIMLEELDLGFGIADLVLAESPSQDERTNRNETFTYNEIFLYGIINRKNGISFDKLKKSTRLSEGLLKKSIKKLINENAISKTEDQYFINHKFSFPNCNSIAIEAKLKNWKRALKQAYRYKWFATYSYVFMDDSNINPAIQNLNLFKSYNVGLASVKENGKIEIHLKPQKIVPYDENMKTLLCEKLLLLRS